MKISHSKMAIAAAFAGLVGGTAVRAGQPHSAPGLSAGLAAHAAFSKKKAIEDACKGMNSCKGNGGGDKKEWVRTHARAKALALPTVLNPRC